ncbi:MAG: helix-hairpin-helix domain-containing protein, partial [Saprospiraceae bacterium]|nr:helix-hairpin-helix domain-containing protein [Saprospiraceae bacterium]
IYAFENDLINQFYIPAYTYRGVRYYLNLKYRGIRDVTLEFRIAQTRLTNRGFISSGNSLIAGNRRTDIKAQVKWVF